MCRGFDIAVESMLYLYLSNQLVIFFFFDVIVLTSAFSSPLFLLCGDVFIYIYIYICLDLGLCIIAHFLCSIFFSFREGTCYLQLLLPIYSIY